jgi:molybdopterin converting factor small subunit
LVKLFGGFRDRVPSGTGGPSFWVDLEDGTNVEALLTHLGIQEEEPKEIIRNHRIGKLDHLLQDGDVVAIFSPLAGGG